MTIMLKIMEVKLHLPRLIYKIFKINQQFKIDMNTKFYLNFLLSRCKSYCHYIVWNNRANEN